MAENINDNEINFKEMDPRELDKVTGGRRDKRLNYIHLLKCPKCKQIAMKDVDGTYERNSYGLRVYTSKTFVCEKCGETKVLDSADNVVFYNPI